MAMRALETKRDGRKAFSKFFNMSADREESAGKGSFKHRSEAPDYRTARKSGAN
jgi:hypothetical protein